MQPDVYTHEGKSFPRVLPSWYNQVCGNTLTGRLPGEGPGMGIFLCNYYGQPTAVRNFGNRVNDNLIADYGVGLSLACQHGTVIRGNSIFLATDPVVQGENLVDCVIEQNNSPLTPP
jgi:hypothetical protein